MKWTNIIASTFTVLGAVMTVLAAVIMHSSALHGRPKHVLLAGMLAFVGLGWFAGAAHIWLVEVYPNVR